MNAELPIPDAEVYEGFPQLENGVGLIASMAEEFDSAIKLVKNKKYDRNVTLVTGEAAASFITGLSEQEPAQAFSLIPDINIHLNFMLFSIIIKHFFQFPAEKIGRASCRERV